MKIKKLTLENINSIAGKWEINFENPEIQRSGLFAISGPTGSGKTSILDGICLALYGQTPRISGSKENVAQVVTNGKNCCLAELLFNVRNCDYLATFSFGSYLRGENKGKLNPATYLHKLAKRNENNEWTVLTSKSGETAKAVIELLGLNADSFLRTILLAQGKFDQFLAANQRDKSAILEQITGTKFYSEITKKIHSEYSELKNDIARLEMERSLLQILSPEEETTLQKQKNETLKQIADLQKQITISQEYCEWFDTVSNCERELSRIQNELQKLNQDIADSEQQKTRLVIAAKAENGREYFQKLQNLESEIGNLKKKIDNNDSELDKFNAELQESQQERSSARNNAETCRQKYDETMAVIRKVRDIDADIRKETAVRKACQKQLDDEQKHKEQLSDKLKENYAQILKLQKEKEESDRYLEDFQHDSCLHEKKSEWTGLLSQLSNLLKNRENSRKKLNEAEKEKNRLQKEWEKKSTEINKLMIPIAECEKKLTALQEKAQTTQSKANLISQEEILNRSILLLKEFHSLEDYRTKHLVKGEPCPLCGSKIHPLTDNLPDAPTIEKQMEKVKAWIKERDELDQAIGFQTIALGDQHSQLNAAKTIAAEKEEELKRANDAIREKCSEENTLSEDIEKLKNTLQNDFNLFQLKWNGDADLPSDLNKRIRSFENAMRKRQEYDVKKAQLDSTMDSTKKQQEECDAKILSLQSECECSQSLLQDKKQLRNQLFGDKDTDSEEKSLEQSLSIANQNRDKAEQNLIRIEERLNAAQERKNTLATSLVTYGADADNNRKLLQSFCADNGFDFEQFNTLLMPPAEQRSLAGKFAKQEEQKKACETSLSEIQIKLEQSREKLPDNTTKADLTEQIRTLSSQVASLQTETGSIGQQLEDNSRKKENARTLDEKLLPKRKKMTVWEPLHALIGQGERFSEAAQQITLEHLLAAANTELAAIYPNTYTLVRPENEPGLGIYVIDAQRGNSIRTTDNLSGGERFVVSLSLALGLSSMVGQNIQIDSLFLDEGFGTLDDNSREIVFHALSKLVDNNKLVGIISHVASIREEIGCVLKTSVTSGYSSIEGPGVTRL